MQSRQIAVLVVEDEPLVRISIVAELEDIGWQVLEAGNALEAIAILEQKPAIDVIFTDVDMPGGLDGLELARLVKDKYPDMQVIVTSGHRDVKNSDLPAQSRFFPKPYASEKIIRTILEIVGPD